MCEACSSGLLPAPVASPPLGVDAWFAPFSYEGVVREVVARVKYRRVHGAVGWLADAMAGVLAPPVPSVVTWVPTTAVRRRERGFDHAELLARQVGRRVGRPVRRLLVRLPGAAQTDLRGAARRHGPVIEGVRAAPAQVLLVDDVATTGASLAAAAAALRAHGADRVVALSAARTPPP